MSPTPLRNDWLAHTHGYVEEMVRARVQAGLAPSATYAVFGPEGVSYSGGLPAMDDVDQGRVAYRIASCTKSFTAATLLMARDRGLLRLDDPVDAYVDARFLASDGSRAQAPTLRQLATMTGGLPIDDPWADRQEAMDRGDFDALAADGLRLARLPGDAWEYSNLGYALLGRVIERVSGRTFMEVLHDDLLVPLDLAGVRLDRSLIADHIMVGRHRLPASPGVLATHWDPVAFSEPGAFSPIGGLFATAVDVARWAAWLSNPHLDGPLSPATRREMQMPYVPLGREPGWYGFGLRIEEHPRLGRFALHSGGYPGFGAHMRWHLESGVGIVMLEGGTYSSPSVTAAPALERIIDEVRPDTPVPDLWPETQAARERVDALLSDLSKERFRALAGESFAPNVAMDEPLIRRLQSLRVLTRLAGTRGVPVARLADCAPLSTSPSQVSWSVRGELTSLRCEVWLTPEPSPRIQLLRVQLTG